MPINALCTADPDRAVSHCESVTTTVSARGAGIICVREFDCTCSSGDVYLPDMLDEERLAEFCDYAVAQKCRAIVRCAFDLEETGIIEAAYKLSPVMLLHKLGVLEFCTIASGVCLDNDDLDLMAQENVPLILLPTADAGYGHGFAPVCAALARGIRVGVGTFDGKYNINHDFNKELEFLKICTNATMSRENSLSDRQLRMISNFI